MKKIERPQNRSKTLIKTLAVFLCYFLYNTVISGVLTAIGITDSTVVSFVADITFLIGIVYIYKDNLKQDFQDLKNNYKISKIIKTVFLWVLVIFVLNIFMGALTEMIYPNASFDDNTNAITSLFEVSTIYSLFKTMIFATIAEELLFRESLSEIIDGKVSFIFISSIVYTLMNFVFTGFDSSIILIDIISYLFPALILSYAYVKNNKNIFILMLIKFTYNLIPTLIFLLELYNKF